MAMARSASQRQHDFFFERVSIKTGSKVEQSEQTTFSYRLGESET